MMLVFQFYAFSEDDAVLSVAYVANNPDIFQDGLFVSDEVRDKFYYYAGIISNVFHSQDNDSTDAISFDNFGITIKPVR